MVIYWQLLCTIVGEKKHMDIFELANRSYKVLKSNLLLFLPPLVLTYLAPVAMAIVALYIFVPVLVVAGNLPNPILPLIGGGFVGGIIMLIVALVLFVAIFAGMANLNKTALLTGKTQFSDFKFGVKNYFTRILGGVIFFAIIYIIIFLIGLGAMVATVFSAVKGLLTPELFQQGFPEIMSRGFPGLPSALILLKTMFQVLANISGIALILITVSALIFIFTLFWIPAAVVDDLSVFRSIRRSVGFVKENFYTTIGYFGLFIIAQLFTRQIFPGGGGGGGGGGVGGGYGITIIIPPALQAIFQLVIITFFVLLLFAIYADRTGKLNST
jgi:hypothetical protein